jgi:hypothetical protein
VQIVVLENVSSLSSLSKAGGTVQGHSCDDILEANHYLRQASVDAEKYQRHSTARVLIPVVLTIPFSVRSFGDSGNRRGTVDVEREMVLAHAWRVQCADHTFIQVLSYLFR